MWRQQPSWNWLCVLAALLYIANCAALGFHSPGLEYDEAISIRGALEMSVHQPVTTFSPEMSFCLQGHCARLMVAPYVGAAKDYFLLPLFWCIGPTVAVARFGAALLVALGILGMSFFVRHAFGGPSGTALAFVLAVHPAVIDLPLYDNGNVACNLFAIGLIGACVVFFNRNQTLGSALLLGVACGFAVWCRMNLAWLILAALVASAAFLRRAQWPPLRMAISFSAGMLIGTAPLLVYLMRAYESAGQAMRAAQWNATVWQAISYVADQIFEILLSDGEHRSIWQGPVVPAWQLAFVSLIAALSLLSCVLTKNGPERPMQFRRIIALTMGLYLVAIIASRLPVAEHHLIVLVPFMATLVCVAPLWKRTGPALLTAAILYLGLAGYWNVRAAIGIRNTGGTISWSNAAFGLSDFLQSSKAGSPVKVLDWGLAQNLYFLSNAHILVEEIFWTASACQSDTWERIVNEGGVFVTNGPTNRHFPVATRNFLAALNKSGKQYITKLFYEKSGTVFAILYDVPSN